MDEQLRESLAMAYTGVSSEDIQAEILESPYAEQVEDPAALAQFIVTLCE